MNCSFNSRWWKDPLAMEIHSVLRVKQNDIPTYFGHSPHLKSRKFLVDWLAIIREKLNLLETTYHLAVYLLDYFMEDHSELAYSQLQLTALTCLAISAKVEERADKVPGAHVLNIFIPKPKKPDLAAFYYKTEYLEMELTILKHFQWLIMKPTAAHFLPYYVSVGVSEDDLYDGFPVKSPRSLQTCVESFAKYFQDISLQYHLFRNYLPSLVSASCVASSRICLHLTPVWPVSLEAITHYCLEELLPCVDLMLKIHNNDTKKDNLGF